MLPLVRLYHPAVPGDGARLSKPADLLRLLSTMQVDVFSFGVMLWEIWTLGDQPYPNLSLQEIFAGVMTGTLRPALPPGCDPSWVSLMQDCWHAVPRMRPSFTDILSRLEQMLQRWSVPPGTAAAPGGGAPAAAARHGTTEVMPGAHGPAGHGPATHGPAGHGPAAVLRGAA